MIEITMPKLSDTMTEGVLGAWKKSVGDSIRRGDVLAEVETDKATMDLEAFETGVLLEQRVEAGQTVAVGTVIALVGEPGDMTVGAGDTGMPPAGDTPEAAVLSPTTASDVRQTAPLESPGPHHRDGGASPVVRRRARELGVELSVIRGTGPGGRVLLEDLERSARSSVQAVGAPDDEMPSGPDLPPAEASPESADGQQPADESVPLTPMRRSIIRTVSESWQTIPHFSVTMDIGMDRAEEMLRQFRAGGIRVTLNDAVVKAAALALHTHPMLNASLVDDAIMLHHDINIGLVVAVPNGLLTPVIRGCQALSLTEIARCSRYLIGRARSGTLREQELHGSTFCISNLGMYGITHFSALIPPRHVGILAVGAVQDTVRMKKGLPTAARTMKLTLSADHRVLDGAYLSCFLNEMRKLLESPLRLVL